MRNTIRKVTMVVPVLITSCHVSLKPKSGPVSAQTTMVADAIKKAAGRPVARAVHLAKRVKRERDFVGLISYPGLTAITCKAQAHDLTATAPEGHARILETSVRHHMQQDIDPEGVAVGREL